jgi:hypothetical protein
MKSKENPWEVVTMPCEGCGHPTRYPRNYPHQRLCLECMEGLLPVGARHAFSEMIDMLGLQQAKPKPPHV